MVTESEGGLQRPTRHPIAWKDPEFYDESLLNQELERVFNICHGCRRCVNLCHAFPTLFDLVDMSATFEIDAVAKEDYAKVVEHCYLCDLCFLSKCPYIPPHEWNVDFPHLMLRAKAVAFKQGKSNLRDRLLTSTDRIGQIGGIPVVREIVNKFSGNQFLRDRLGIHREANIPIYHKDQLKKRRQSSVKPVATESDTSKVVLFATCYNRMESAFNEDMLVIFEHSGITTALMKQENCCGIPKFELGDLERVDKLKKKNLPQMIEWIDQGFDIIAAVPSCVLMFKQELPLMFPDDEQVMRVAEHIFDPSFYLMQHHKAGLLNLNFKRSLGQVVYHAACHTRVQSLGLKTRDLLKLVPDTEVSVIERCSGHDGIYAVKAESHAAAVKIGRPVARKLDQQSHNYFTSDCMLAGAHIASLSSQETKSFHPMSLLRLAYGI